MNNKELSLKYLNSLGIKPKNVTNHHIQISCPICNDKKWKYRGYILLDSEVPIYNCFNCETDATSFYTFLDNQNHNLANQYKKEIRKNKILSYKKDNTEDDIKKVFESKTIKLEDIEIKDNLSFLNQVNFDNVIYTKTVDGEFEDEEYPLQELPDKAIEYLQGRGFKEDDYKDFKYCIESNDIVIPFWSNKDKNLVYGMQTRNLTEKFFHNQNLRYNLKIYNLGHVLNLPKGITIYAFESIFDMISSGIKDSIAVIGSKLSREGEDLLKDYNIVMCLDADEAGYYSTINYAKLGYSVLVHKQEMNEFKDVNKLLEMGMTKDKIKDYILENIHKPLKARMILKQRGYET